MIAETIRTHASIYQQLRNLLAALRLTSAAVAHPGLLEDATTAGGPPPPKPSPIRDYAHDPDY